MNRPWLTWTILGVCAALILGVMALSTNKVLDLETKQKEAEAAAELEERIRLSLSRMDTAASGLLVLENQRPPHHFKSFFEPEDVYTTHFQQVRKGAVVQPSPLLRGLPDFVRLHFEINPHTQEVHSPQVPQPNERDRAETQGVGHEYLNAASQELARLREILNKPGEASAANNLVGTNLDILCQAYESPDQFANWNDPQAQDLVLNGEWRLNRGQNRGRGKGQISAEKYQEQLGLVNKTQRAEVYRNSAQRAITREAVPNSLGNQGNSPFPQGSNDANQEDALIVPPGWHIQGFEGLTTRVSPFEPIWLGKELFAIREVAVGPDVRFQGVWLDAPQVAEYLLSAATGLLDQAALDPIEEVSAASLPDAFSINFEELSNDPLSLVTLPWRLSPGEIPVPETIGWSPLRVSLVVGWAALFLALIAAAVLVRAIMKLSDRRATFVSSVTHELRTPLTTFHLYSEMLAEGMVHDEEKRRGYLNTMRQEAERLNHLVENVLSYSRVERGSARAEHQKISLQDLLDRMEPRLTQRTDKDDAKLEVDAIPEADRVHIDTDLTAVEQIVFNLVDNACKYGLPEEGDRVVSIQAANGGSTARIEVSDSGAGIDRSDVKKLFRAFHKSARDAAHSKPGVGLGLALSRRLARELGGDLSLDANCDKGARFVLELPVAEKT